MKNMIITIAIVLLMSLLLEIQTDMNLMALGRLSGRQTWDCLQKLSFVLLYRSNKAKLSWDLICQGKGIIKWESL